MATTFGSRSGGITPRRALMWGLALVVLLVAIGLGVGLVRRASGAMDRIGTAAPPVITQQLVVERLQTVAKLVATEMTLRDVVIYEQTRYGSTKRALLVVTGKVSAGLDLSRGTDVSIDSASRRIALTLPPAQIISVDILNVTTYDESAGLLNPFRAEDRDIMQRRVRSQLMEAARQSGILAHADEGAAKMLTELLGRDGYTVEIRRPPVQVQPTG
jgi:hypothetical protein